MRLIVYADPQHVFDMIGPRWTMCLFESCVWAFPRLAEVGFLLGSFHCSGFSCPWAATGGRSEHISREGGWGPSKGRNGIHHFALLEQVIFPGLFVHIIVSILLFAPVTALRLVSSSQLPTNRRLMVCGTVR